MVIQIGIMAGIAVASLLAVLVYYYWYAFLTIRRPNEIIALSVQTFPFIFASLLMY